MSHLADSGGVMKTQEKLPEMEQEEEKLDGAG